MATVTIDANDGIQQTDVDVTVSWEADFVVQNTAQFLLATSLQNLQNGVYVATGDDSGNCPATLFQTSAPTATPWLSAGTEYFIMATCDGVNSAPTSFTTAAAGEHLGRLQSTPHVVKPSADSILSLMVRDKGKGVANVPVTFTAPAGAGSINGQPAGSPVVVNTDSTGSAKATLTVGTQKGRYAIAVSAQPYCAKAKTIKVRIQ